MDSPLNPFDPADLRSTWEQNRLEQEEEERYRKWARDVRTNPFSGGGSGLLLVLYTIAVVVATMVVLGGLMSAGGVSGFRGRPGALFAIPGLLAGLGFFAVAGRLFYNLRGDAQPRARKVARAFVTGATVVLVGAVAGSVTGAFKFASTPAGGVPDSFFRQASADFDEAKRLLADGRVADSGAKFAASQTHRQRAGDRPVATGETFEAWCAQREQEYRAAAASLPERAAAAAGPPIHEVDAFLDRYGDEAIRAAWQERRPDIQRRLSTAAAANAYRIEWVIETEDGIELEDLTDDDRKPLGDAVAARMASAGNESGNAAGKGTPKGRGVPFIPASAAPGIGPEVGLGYVKVTLVFSYAAYGDDKGFGDRVVKVATGLASSIEVTTNSKAGPWDGLHHYTASVDPPSRLNLEGLSTTNRIHQDDLIRQVVEKINGNPNPKSPWRRSGMFR